MKRVESHIFQGMQRDVSISKQQPQFLWDAENIRLTAREGDTLMSVTNERGSEKTDIALTGSYMGHCVLGNYLTVFTTSDKDCIYRITKNSDGSFSTKQLYGINGNDGQESLGFDPEHPLQTLGIYENEKIQKVYWTDGINQPRVINIVKDIYNEGAESYYINTSFDFVPEMKLTDSIKIQKLSDSNGSFPAGVIQYAVTYYNKYGQQSNISCVSPLIPISFFSRAGSPEEKVSNSFRVIVNSPDTSFEYLRLYSIQRTSLNGTPICRRVEDIRLGDGGSSGTYYKIETSGIITLNSFWVTGASQATRSDGTSFTGAVYTEHVPYVNNGSFFHIQKNSSTKHLVIKIQQQNNTYKYITWGDATEIFISENSLAGGAGTAYYVVGADGMNATGDFRKSANLFISTEEIQYVEKSTVESVVITDNGIIGETIDPQELLYIGGEDITAETIESKDGTLFFGNIRLNQVPIDDIKTKIKNAISNDDTNTNNIIQGIRATNRPVALNGNNYKWGNSLNAKDDKGYATNPAGLKFGEHYRLGVQFQYKNGKWSEPVYIKDDCITSIDCKPNLADTADIEKYNIPRFEGKLYNTNSIITTLINRGYKRVRGVIVFPTASDRLILAQGILNPTVASVTAHAQHSPDYQSSWFFRPWINDNNWDVDNDSSIMNGAIIEWRHRRLLFGFNDRGSEIQGLPEEYKSWTMKPNVDKIKYNILGYGGEGGKIQVDSGKRKGNDPWRKFVHVDDNMMDTAFYVNQQYVTMHSPEFEFNDSLKNLDFIGVKLRKRGYVAFNKNVGDILIETSSPPIGKESTGFIHKSLSWSGDRCRRLCAGIFYNDWLVDDNNKYEQWSSQGYEYGFMVYPWHRSGSLNNDCNRPASEGTRSAVLKRKIISNILYARQSFTREYGDPDLDLGLDQNIPPQIIHPQMFDVDQVGLVKIDGQNYYGNIDTLLTPMATYGTLISVGGDKNNLGSDEEENVHSRNVFTSAGNYFWKGTLHDFERINLSPNLNPSDWEGDHGNGWDSRVGNDNRSLRTSKESIRMKYKSTPHLLFKLRNNLSAPTQGKYTTSMLENYSTVYNSLHFVELYRKANSATDFGGKDDDALQANVWVPAGEAETLKTSGTTFYYDWGDTWYQRYDCLKTYPFTHEDENQIVEIGSFMVETHVNIDGRYDRNRGQDSNLYVDPENFNLINPVYSQLDNFFNYKIMNSDFYKLNSFPATVAWTLQKNNASEVDAWTNITLGNTLDMDGNAGKVTSVNTSMDTLYCFQERGVSQIMFNSRVQIPASDGVPIELSNSYKVDGSHYISNTIGCPNKFAIAKSPMGLYFVDGVGSTLYLLQGNQMQNISDNHGMGYWFSQQDTQNTWVPHSYGRNGEGMRLCYDNVNGDLYIMPEQGKALCYSDQLQQFVSFYDYYACGLFNIGNSVHALTNEGEQDITVSLHNLFTGEYNKLLGTYYPSSITFVSNADMQMDKIFTNLELRADFYKGDELQHMHFFDTIRAWNEYQDTDWIDEYGNLNTTSLEHKYFPYSSTSITSNVKKKFRIWRVDIPRAKKWIAYTEEEKQAMIDSGKYTTDTVPAGHFINVNDRIRNTWCKIKLTMNVPPQELEGYEPYRMEMHDTSVIYYI